MTGDRCFDTLSQYYKRCCLRNNTNTRITEGTTVNTQVGDTVYIYTWYIYDDVRDSIRVPCATSPGASLGALPTGGSHWCHAPKRSPLALSTGDTLPMVSRSVVAGAPH